jgi:diketogulonate reductase-like aldo/keto reductase
MVPNLMLNNRAEIPQLGLGVYQVPPGEECVRTVRTALELGYRHIDTARYYSNERDVGRAIKESGIPREEIFVTTKLANEDHGEKEARRACEQSLRQLDMEYVDLYLIHWPVPELRRASWRAMEAMQREGKCRSIGVSNYMIHHLEELLGEAEIVPAVNQVELHPFLTHEKLRAFCASGGIAVETYCPLTQGRRLKNKVVGEIAASHERSPAQIMLRWAVQHGMIVIPKSVRRERIEENSKIFDFQLDAAELARLDGLNENLHVSWDPTTAP